MPLRIYTHSEDSHSIIFFISSEGSHSIIFSFFHFPKMYPSTRRKVLTYTEYTRVKEKQKIEEKIRKPLA